MLADLVVALHWKSDKKEFAICKQPGHVGMVVVILVVIRLSAKRTKDTFRSNLR